MTRATFFSLCVLVATCSLPLEAQATFYADLDTKEGHFSMWRADGLEGTRGCTFEAELVAAYEDARWAPAATISVRGSSEKARIFLQLRRARKKEPFKGRVQANDERGPRGKDLDVVAKVGQPFSVAVSWVDGGVAFTVDGQVVANIESPFEVTTLEISASTAQLKVRNLAFQLASK